MFPLLIRCHSRTQANQYIIIKTYKKLYIVYQTNLEERQMPKHVASIVNNDCLVISCVNGVKKITYDSF